LIKTYSSLYEGEVLHELFKLSLPKSDSLYVELRALKKQIDWAIPETLGQDSKSFIKTLVETRYIPLYSGLTIETSTDFSPCHEIDPEDLKVLEELSEPLIKDIVRISGALNDFGPIKVRVIEEYVEYLVNKIASAEDAYNFYSHCFDLKLSNSKSTADDIE